MQKQITVTRDSVAMSDDFDAPHLIIINVDVDAKINEILDLIKRLKYLPKIAGSYATWSVASNQPLAIIAQEWTEPKLICSPEYPVQGLNEFYNIEKLHFNYYAQENPDTVYKILSTFKKASN
ncbi:MAG: hypothetical protein V4548_10370 [Bacteroidota bacterium]